MLYRSIYLFRGIILTLVTLVFISLPNSLNAQEKTKAEKGHAMKTYLIKLPHTPENCLQTLDQISKDKPEMLSEIEWGCMSGDHTGYLSVKGIDEESALAVLPAALRKSAQIEEMNKFTKEQIRSFHQKQKKMTD